MFGTRHCTYLLKWPAIKYPTKEEWTVWRKLIREFYMIDGIITKSIGQWYEVKQYIKSPFLYDSGSDYILTMNENDIIQSYYRNYHTGKFNPNPNTMFQK